MAVSDAARDTSKRKPLGKQGIGRCAADQRSAKWAVRRRRPGAAVEDVHARRGVRDEWGAAKRAGRSARGEA